MTLTHFTRALVTGASSGIGEAMCRLLARQGIPLIITGRDISRLNALAEKLKDQVDVIVVAADLFNPLERQKLIELLYEHHPDLIINNAGFGLYGDILTHQTKEQMKIIDVNVSAVVELTIESAKTLAAIDKKGVILNISSAADKLIFPAFSIYCASKAFVTQFSQSLDYEMKPHGIRVLVASPGRVDTSFAERASGSSKASKSWFSMSSEYAAERLWQQIRNGQSYQIFDWKTRLGSFFLRFVLPKRIAARILWSSIQRYGE